MHTVEAYHPAKGSLPEAEACQQGGEAAPAGAASVGGSTLRDHARRLKRRAVHWRFFTVPRAVAGFRKAQEGVPGGDFDFSPKRPGRIFVGNAMPFFRGTHGYWPDHPDEAVAGEDFLRRRRGHRRRAGEKPMAESLGRLPEDQLSRNAK